MAITPAATPAPIPPAAPAPATSPAPAPPTYYLSPANPATFQGQEGLGTPALRALPVEATSDASTSRRFYTLTAALREIYDGNVSTSNTNQQASVETNLSPSVLVDFPTADGDLSGRYTLGVTYYARSPNHNGDGSTSNSASGNNNNNQSSLEVSHEVVASYSHTFSQRASMTVQENLRYFTEPSLLQSTGTNYQSGPYVANQLNGNFNLQLTPLFSTTTTYANTIVRYVNSTVAQAQNNIQNTGSESLNYAFLPKVPLSIGGLLDNITYESANRGYTTYTLFGGVSWQLLPSLTLGGRAGASYIEANQSQGSIAPYAALTLNWTLGARSAVNFNYSHDVTPSDQVGSNGQMSDRFSGNFSYLITPRLSANLNGIYTISTTSGGLSGSNSAANNYEERVYAVTGGFGYAYSSILSFDAGLSFSGVQANISNNNYIRDEAYVGIRGTY